MSNTSITNVEITDTFQVWISKTNGVIEILNENVMLAGPDAGYTVGGNSTITGSFAANSLSATSASLNSITTAGITRSEDITLPVDFFSPIRVINNQEDLLTLQTTVGSRPILQFVNGSNQRWELGQSTAAANSSFSIRIQGSTLSQMSLSQAGNLTVAGTISTSGEFSGNLTGNVVGNVNGNVTGTVSSLSNHTTNALAEGTNNLYFTNVRARSAISITGNALSYTNGVLSVRQEGIRTMLGAGLNVTYDSVTGEFSVTNTAIRGAFSSGVGIAYNIETGQIATVQNISTTGDVTFNSVTTTGNVITNSIRAGSIQSSVVSGIITSEFSSLGPIALNSTFTPSTTLATDQNNQFIQNSGSFVIGAPSIQANRSISLVLYIVNITGAGAITFSGFARVVGDSITTTVGHSFYVYITRFGAGPAIANVVAAQ